jgi:hypothetical protein
MQYKKGVPRTNNLMMEVEEAENPSINLLNADDKLCLDF